MLCRSVPTWSLLLALGPCPLAASVPAEEPLLLGPAYPIEVGISLPFALLHWLDSLAGLHEPGMTAGKTVAAHRGEYVRSFGALDAESERVLRGFAAARARIALRLPPDERNAPSLVFLEAADVESALRGAAGLATADELASIRAAFEHFEPRYDRIWDGAATARRFAAGVAGDERRKPLAALLASIARFYGVPTDGRPRPRIVLVPVSSGHGTHAQTIGRHLLIEIRAGEGLAEQVAPIVHENAHFLFQRLDRARREALARVAEARGDAGREAWRLLHEALPTALGQGVAGRRFQGDWSAEDNWYHVEAVDAYAKRLFPLVRDALHRGGRLDEAFVLRAVALLPGEGAGPTRRSP